MKISFAKKKIYFQIKFDKIFFHKIIFPNFFFFLVTKSFFQRNFVFGQNFSLNINFCQNVFIGKKNSFENKILSDKKFVLDKKKFL